MSNLHMVRVQSLSKIIWNTRSCSIIKQAVSLTSSIADLLAISFGEITITAILI